MKQAKVVKKSISMPESLWAFVERHSKKSGHGMASRTIQEAIEKLKARTAK
jgi:hypothetical protein